MELSANSRPPAPKRFALVIGANDIRSASTMKLAEAAHKMSQLAPLRMVRRSRVLPDPLFELSCSIEGRRTELMQKGAEVDVLDGIARDSAPLSTGIKWTEIDDRGCQACFTGMNQRGITDGFSVVGVITAPMPAGRASVRLSDRSELLLSSRSNVRLTDHRRSRNYRYARIPARVGLRVPSAAAICSRPRARESIVIFCVRQAGAYSSAQRLNGCL